MTTLEKREIVEKIRTEIADLQCDIGNQLHSAEEIIAIKLDLDSFKSILGHLETLKTC